MRNVLRDLKISTKIYLLVGLTLLLMGLVIGIGLRQINKVGKEVTMLAETNLPLMEVAIKITALEAEHDIILERLIPLGRLMIQEEARNNFNAEGEKTLELGRMINQELENGKKIIEGIYEKYETSGQRDSILKIDYGLRNIHKEYAKHEFASERILNLFSQGKLEKAETAIQELVGQYEAYSMDRALKSFLSEINSFTEVSAVRAKKSQQDAIVGMLSRSALVLLFSLSMGVFVSRSISKPLRIAVNAAQQISAGDRDIKIEAITKDETGQLLKAMEKMSCSIRESDESLMHQASELEQSNTALKQEITERERAEEALEISNRDLTLTAEKLEESNRELKDFVYIASHDLREPLRKISSFGELLKDSLEGKLDRDDQENLEFMVDGANRMTEMIEGLLTYSRVNTKGISFQVVNLNEVVEQLEQLELAVLLEETGGTIEVPQPLPVAEADPIQMRQLLQNLIANGIKYHRDEVRPRIVIRAKHTDGDKVRIEVQDNGIGIKEEHCEDIFTMFRRLHPRQRYGGTGIGLAVCRKITDRHGGRIGVESKYGEGTTLWFTLSAVSEAVAVS